MNRVVHPPECTVDPSGLVKAGWWHDAEPGRIVCDLCPRECHLKPGDRGFCFVRQNIDGQMFLTTYGRSTGFCIDPVEKKPLNHFYPGTSVLSFGTAGCNLGCKFCQNWDISKSREVERLSELALPETIAQAALRTGCQSVAFTYNDPIVWAEYAIDTARECRSAGIGTIAVTAGYICPEARPRFFQYMDAANVDLKAFTEEFYQQVTYSHLQPVLDTLTWLKKESNVWFEITNLVIPGENDSEDEFRRMCDWIVEAVGPEVPVHFSAFHPDFRMLDHPKTPVETLLRARETAARQGVQYAYVGNIHDTRHQSTWCPGCGSLLIERNWYQLGRWGLKGSLCGTCQKRIPGVFADRPGTWGPKRLPIRISEYAAARPAEPKVVVSESRAMTKTVEFTELQKQAIHRTACEIVAAAVERRDLTLTDASLGGAASQKVIGAFVTLKRNHQLRGCVGQVGEPVELLSVLKKAGVRTALEDLRFPPVTRFELPWLTLDVSVLLQMEEVQVAGAKRIDEIVVGRHGVRIVQGGRSGLLLPVVAVEQRWDSKTLLENVCRKAGLPNNAWLEPDSRLYRFEGIMIDGDFRQDAIRSEPERRVFRMSSDQLAWLTEFARSNVVACFRGAVPSYFPTSFPDREITGIGLQLFLPHHQVPVAFSRVELRGGVPLQMSLLELTHLVGDWLRRNRVPAPSLDAMSIRLLEFAEPALHGYVANPDLRGVHPKERVLAVTDGRSMEWAYQPDGNPKEMFERLTAGRDRSAAGIQVVSFAVQSFAIEKQVPIKAAPVEAEKKTVPTPEPTPVVEPEFVVKAPPAFRSAESNGMAERPAAVAGRFYSADSNQLDRDLDDCFGGSQVTAGTEQWPAIMVPHAGLRFSGRIAAETFRRVHIPSSVIIIGPKHTPFGRSGPVLPVIDGCFQKIDGV